MAGLEQALQFAVMGRWYERLCQRVIDPLVVGDLVVHVGLIEGGTRKLGELGPVLIGVLHEALAGIVVFGRNVEFLDQRERFVIHHRVILHHVIREGANVVVLRFFKRLALMSRSPAV
jgi:hypothetical protein